MVVPCAIDVGLSALLVDASVVTMRWLACRFVSLTHRASLHAGDNHKCEHASRHSLFR
jgi:hypothetical protein